MAALLAFIVSAVALAGAVITAATIGAAVVDWWRAASRAGMKGR